MMDKVTVYQKSGKVKRPYRSPRRQAQAQATRTTIVKAAGRLFVEKGYAQTSVREIAKAAGVAEPTVYATLGDKPSIADAVVRAMAERLGTTVVRELEDALRSEPRPAARARLFAKVSQEAYSSEAMLLRDALMVGAASDPRLTRIVEELSREGRELTDRLVGLVLGDRDLSSRGRKHATDVIWTISGSAVYRRLVEACGWSAAEYEDWLTLEMRRAIRDAERQSTATGASRPPTRRSLGANASDT